MKRRSLAFAPDARTDLADIWQLINTNDGAERADALLGRIEAFIRSLEEFSDIGQRHNDRRPGMRSCGVPGLKSVTVVFKTTSTNVTVLRIGYLGRNVLPNLP